jgi:hypothetical protein
MFLISYLQHNRCGNSSQAFTFLDLPVGTFANTPWLLMEYFFGTLAPLRNFPHKWKSLHISCG